MTVDRRFVEAWAREYERRMGSAEPRLFTEVGPAAAARGFYEAHEFVAVARWKTPRSKRFIEANSDADVRDVTGIAFAAPEHIQHRLLTILDGVQVRTGTALLTVAFPHRHTILDFRTTEALGRLGEWDGTGGYPAYLASCRAVAERLHVTLRAVDRALWRWSKAGYPQNAP